MSLRTAQTKMSSSRATTIKKEEDTDEDSVECIGVSPAPQYTADAPKLTDNDVLCVHGETTLEHPGNVAYQRLINLNRGLYANESSLKGKLQISKSIVASIRRNNGRFLEHDSESGVITSLHTAKWQGVSDGKAAEFTLNALRGEGQGRQRGSYDKAARSTQSDPATIAEVEVKCAPSPVDPTLLIRLTREQSSKMKYPIGCQIWYNIHYHDSSLCDATIGYVTSISMDVTARDLLYEVSPAKTAESTTNEKGQQGKEFFLEEHLCYACKCPILVQHNESMLEGEVITPCFLNGRVDKVPTKSYMVSVFLKKDQVRIFQAVKEARIKYRPASKPGNIIDKQGDLPENATRHDLQKSRLQQTVDKQQPANTTQLAARPDGSHWSEKEAGKIITKKNATVGVLQTHISEHEVGQSRKSQQPAEYTASVILAEDSFQCEEEAGEETTEDKVTGTGVQSNIADQKAARLPLKSTQTSSAITNSLISEDFVSPNKDGTSNSKTATAGSKVFMESTLVHNLAVTLPQDTSRRNLSSSSSTNKWPCSLDPKRGPSTALPLISVPSRKRMSPSAPSLTSNVAEAINTSYQRVLKRQTNSEYGSMGNITFTSKEKTANKSEYLRLLTTLSNYRDKGRSSPARKLFQLPCWLVNGYWRNEVLEAVNGLIKRINTTAGYNISIDEKSISFKNEPQFSVGIYVLTERNDEDLRIVIEEVEDLLVKLIGADESRGKLLYDIALSYGDIRQGDVVNQRNPLNSCERIWMTLVDIPSELIQENPFLERTFQDSIHLDRCTLIVCRDNLNGKPLRCSPYVLVLGKQVRDVENGAALTKTVIQQSMQRNGDAINHAKHHKQDISSRYSHESMVGHSMVSELESNGSPRKMVLPHWLLADSLYVKEIEGGLFGAEWCKEKEFYDCTGCDLVRSQDYLLIKPPKNDQYGSNVNRAMHMIEDALLDFLGASESKCMLLYDLANLCTKPHLDGIVRIRNPLNSKECVWANVIKLSHSGNLFTPMITKDVNEEMHRLKCTLKVCKESFGIEMRNCQPYAMIMGQQQISVREAVGFVKQFIKKKLRRMKKNHFKCREMY